MKYAPALLLSAAALSASLSTQAANYTQVQVGGGAIYYGLYQRDQDFKSAVKSEQRTQPTVSLQISGQVTERSQRLWFDMFLQQADSSHAEFQVGNEQSTHEVGATVFGMGGRLMILPGYSFSPYVKAGGFAAKWTGTETTKNTATNTTSKESLSSNDKGYYVGGGVMQRVNLANSLTLDYAGYKANDFNNFQHNIQLGWVFHF